MPDPWSYAKTSEHSHQAALFMWANMAQMFGPVIADDPHSYTVAGFAKTQFENAGKLGYKIAGEPIKQFKWLHAIHNQGHGDAVRGATAKAEGVKAGVYDMFLPVPKCEPWGTGFPNGRRLISACGFYLELKIGKGKPSDKQNEFAADMREAGYATDVAWGWLEARNKLLDYLGLPLYP